VEDGDRVHMVEDGHEGWQDMAAFATAVRDPRIRGMLDDALKGGGAFSRFRRAIDQADLAAEWHCFADDRRWGRARQRLADIPLLHEALIWIHHLERLRSISRQQQHLRHGNLLLWVGRSLVPVQFPTNGASTSGPPTTSPSDLTSGVAVC
jgi:hypothetical protein